MEFATTVCAELEDMGDGVRGVRLARIRGETLATAVWELDPGATVEYCTTAPASSSSCCADG